MRASRFLYELLKKLCYSFNMNFKLNTKYSKGFSLIELLTALTLIGILSTLSIVKMKSYQRKGKTTEAKVMLTNLFGSERVYILEHENYHYDLYEIGLELVGKYTYNIGFKSPPFDGNCPPRVRECTSPPVNFNTFKICGATFGSGSGSNKDCLVKVGSVQDVESFGAKCTGSSFSSTEPITAPYGQLADQFKGFNALACADLGGSDVDVWSMDQRKNLVHRKKGTQ